MVFLLRGAPLSCGCNKHRYQQAVDGPSHTSLSQGYPDSTPRQSGRPNSGRCQSGKPPGIRNRWFRANGSSQYEVHPRVPYGTLIERPLLTTLSPALRSRVIVIWTVLWSQLGYHSVLETDCVFPAGYCRIPNDSCWGESGGGHVRECAKDF